jgi:hypothetical protein
VWVRGWVRICTAAAAVGESFTGCVLIAPVGFLACVVPSSLPYLGKGLGFFLVV